MRLQALTPDVVRRAVGIYQDIAYGQAGRARRAHAAVAEARDLDAVLGMFQKEQVEPIPGYPCLRYSLRLGNRNYPFMKLLLQEHLVPGEFFFTVDTHDQMDIKPNFPDYEAWMAVRRFNRELKRRIETEFKAAGLETAATLRQICVQRTAADTVESRGQILIVDDEEDLADAVAALLRARGFLTCKVNDPRDTVRIASELLPNLVVLDYEMPELDGLQVIAQLRADPLTQGIPVLLASAGKVSMADIRQADGFLAKPFQEGLLYDLVDRLLQPREALP
jgi:CheY-like chemotaxis protein